MRTWPRVMLTATERCSIVPYAALSQSGTIAFGPALDLAALHRA